MKHCLLIFLLAISFQLLSQELRKTTDFVVSSAYLEPDGSLLSVQDRKHIIAFAKSKPVKGQRYEYILRKLDYALVVKWSISLEVMGDHHYTDMYLQDDRVILLSTVFDEKFKQHFYYAEAFNLTDGVRAWKKQLLRAEVGDWREVDGKGTTFAGMRNTIRSGSDKRLVMPLGYEFYATRSPKGNRLLVYRFDYSKPDLMADMYLFDASFNMISEAHIPVNKGFTNHQILVNDASTVYMVNTKSNSDMAVIKYDLSTKSSDYLEIQASNTTRHSLRSLLLSEDKLLVGHLNVFNNQFAGVSYSEFDFGESKVGKIVFHEVDPQFKKMVDSVRKASDQAHSDEHWDNYELIGFQVDSLGDKILVVERQDYKSQGMRYNPDAVNNPAMWTGERVGELYTEDAFIFKFDRSGNLIWSQTVVKSQKSNARLGLNYLSLRYRVTPSGNVTVVYGDHHGDIHLKRFYGYTGQTMIDSTLENPDKMNLLTVFSEIYEDRVILAGKKGYAGSESEVRLYKLQ